MSVINEMLKDLDQRSSNNKNRASAVLAGTGYVVDDQNSTQDNDLKLKVIIGLLVMLTIIVVVSAYRFFNIEPQLSTAINSTNENAAVLTSQTQNTVSGSVKDIVLAVEAVVENSSNKILDKTSDKTSDKTESLSLDNHSIIEQPKVIAKVVENDSRDRVIKSNLEIKVADLTEQLFSVARSDIENGNLSLAKEKLNKSLALDNNFHNARVLLLSVLLEQNQLKQMASLVETSVDQWPENSNYRLMQARLLLQHKDAKEALTVLMSNIPKVDKAADYHALLAFTAQQVQDDQLAAKHYKLLLQSHPNKASWWLGLGVSEERLGNKSSALRSYKQSISRPGLSQNVRDYARQRIKVIQGF